MAKDKALEVEQVETNETETVEAVETAETAEVEQVEAAQEAEAEQTAEAVEVQREGVVKMVRNAEEHPEPHEADVAASEVEHYKTYGWTEA